MVMGLESLSYALGDSHLELRLGQIYTSRGVWQQKATPMHKPRKIFMHMHLGGRGRKECPWQFFGLHPHGFAPALKRDRLLPLPLRPETQGHSIPASVPGGNDVGE